MKYLLNTRTVIWLGDVTVDNLIEFAEEIGFQLIGLSPEQAITYGMFAEDSHFDPFDRMLIWQTIRRNLTTVSRDSEFDVKRLFPMECASCGAERSKRDQSEG